MTGKLSTPYRWITTTAHEVYERPNVKPHVDELTLAVKDRLTFDLGKRATAALLLTSLSVAGWWGAIGSLPYLLPRVLSPATSDTYGSPTDRAATITLLLVFAAALGAFARIFMSVTAGHPIDNHRRTLTGFAKIAAFESVALAALFADRGTYTTIVLAGNVALLTMVLLVNLMFLTIAAVRTLQSIGKAERRGLNPVHDGLSLVKTAV